MQRLYKFAIRLHLKMNKNTEKIRFHISLGLSLLFVAIMWISKLFEITANMSFAEFGVYPLSFSGLKGLLFSPFIHGDLKHLFSNTLPFLILLTGLFFFYPKERFSILAIIWFLSGFVLWLIGRKSFHIGASGLIYAFASFHFFSGVLSKRKEFIALSLIVVFLYGGLIWGMFPGGDEKISWEAHLAGFAVGAFISLFFYPKDLLLKQKVQLFDNKVNFNYFYDFKNCIALQGNHFNYNNKSNKKSSNYQILTNENFNFNYPADISGFEYNSSM